LLHICHLKQEKKNVRKASSSNRGKSPIEKKDKNHSCGHNLFAGGSVAAAIATKNFIEEKGVGTVTLFGCPGEEGGAGKVYMARDVDSKKLAELKRRVDLIADGAAPMTETKTL
jgi:metal-dependent amidase/aminoacylase/carboxypeptidase family protein